MRPLKILALAFVWITVPVVLESCCFSPGHCGCFNNSDDVYVNIDDMRLDVLFGGSTNVPAAKISELIFMVEFETTRAMLEAAGGSTLYACSPAPAINNQKIAAVVITSNAVLATAAGSIPAGENLNFSFSFNAAGHVDDPISDLINNPLLDKYITFGSKVILASKQTHTFTFKLTLDDGRSFSLVTKPLELVQG